MTAIKNTFTLPKLEEIEQIMFIEHRNHRVLMQPSREGQLNSIFQHHEITKIVLNRYYSNEEIGGNLKLTSVHGIVESREYPGIRTINHVDNITPLTDNGQRCFLVRDTKGRLFKMSADYIFPKFTYTKMYPEY